MDSFGERRRLLRRAFRLRRWLRYGRWQKKRENNFTFQWMNFFEIELRPKRTVKTCLRLFNETKFLLSSHSIS